MQKQLAIILQLFRDGQKLIIIPFTDGSSFAILGHFLGPIIAIMDVCCHIQMNFSLEALKIFQHTHLCNVKKHKRALKRGPISSFFLFSSLKKFVRVCRVLWQYKAGLGPKKNISEHLPQIGSGADFCAF